MLLGNRKRVDLRDFLEKVIRHHGVSDPLLILLPQKAKGHSKSLLCPQSKVVHSLEHQVLWEHRNDSHTKISFYVHG